MGRIAEENIAGYHIEDEIVCKECVTDSELRKMKQHQVITWDEIEKTDDSYFCDRCEEVLDHVLIGLSVVRKAS